jgi:hypothetical protein
MQTRRAALIAALVILPACSSRDRGQTQARQNAIIQRQTIGMRGRVAYRNERPAEPVSPNEPQAPAPTGPAEGRAWIYWSQNVSLD